MNTQQNSLFDDADNELIARFTVYIQKVVVNAKIDYIRRQRHWKWEIASDMLPEPPVGEWDSNRWQNAVPDSEFDFAEENISNELSALPSLRRRILELSFIEELSALEIADMLGCSVKFVYNQKHTALKKLRDALLRGGEAE